MTNISTGMNFDIVLFLINKYGSDVTITPVTKTTSNVEGDETLAEGTTYSERIYITRKTADWMFDQSGLIKGGDAHMLITPDSEIKKDDVVTWNNNNYRVQMIIDRDQPGGQVMFKSGNLFLI